MGGTGGGAGAAAGGWAGSDRAGAGGGGRGRGSSGTGSSPVGVRSSPARYVLLVGRGTGTSPGTGSTIGTVARPITLLAVPTGWSADGRARRSAARATGSGRSTGCRT